MMKKFLAYLICGVVLAGLCGCNPYDVEEILISRDDVSLTIKGEPVFVFDKGTCQIAYNADRYECRAMTDDVSEYFILKAHVRMTHAFQEFLADLTYTSAGEVLTQKNLPFRIEKIDNSTGLVWLWCSEEAIGVVVKLF